MLFGELLLIFCSRFGIFSGVVAVELNFRSRRLLIEHYSIGVPQMFLSLENKQNADKCWVL